jgi:hypothetical protein
VAWVAVGAVVGLAICGLWALSSIVRERAAKAGPPRTGPPRPARPRSRGVLLAVFAAVAVLLVGLVAFLVTIDLRGAASDGAAAPATTTSPTSPGVVRPAPQPVRVAVFNASGFAKPATDVVGVLRGFGYTITGTVTTTGRATSAVQCRDGFAADAEWIAYLLGRSVANDVFPDPPPPEAADVDCIVVVGRAL